MPASGAVWTVQGLHPRLARPLASVDLHALRTQVLDEVLASIGHVPVILAPAVPRYSWRLAVRAQDEQAVRRALSTLPPYMQVTSRERGHGLRIRPHFAQGPDARPVHPATDLDVMIDMLESDGRHETTEIVGGVTGVRECEWERRSAESLKSSGRRYALPEPSMPVDVVYTWVDGSDPAWRARRDAALSEVLDGESDDQLTRPAPHDGLPLHPTAYDDSRYTDSDELRYSLRSLHRFANWVRTVHIVTDGQVPPWLDTSDPRIHLVDHRDIIGDSRFNSHAIEASLHRIEGLAEHYLYLNDDVFFGRIAHRGDFFVSDGTSRFFPSDLPITPGEVGADDLPIMAAAKNGRDLLARRFGMDVQVKVRHAVHPQLRSVCEQIERENPERMAVVRANRFRSPTDLSVPTFLHHWYAFALGRAVPTDLDYLYIDLADEHLGQKLDALGSLQRYDTFCLNEERTTPAVVDGRTHLAPFLDRYFPDPAPWERA